MGCPQNRSRWIRAGQARTVSFLLLFMLVLLTQVPRSSAAEPVARGTRWALVFWGHPGDAEHEAAYSEIVDKLRKGLTTHCGFPADQVLVWSGSNAQNPPKAAPAGVRGPATREAIEAGVKELRTKLKPEDTLWVIVGGHAHFDGRRTFFNLPGPDIDTEQFGKLFRGTAAREQVFFITTAVSGYAIPHLSQKGRVVITATEADREVNETIFGLALAELLVDPPPKEELDRDRDGRVTLLDLYLTLSREVLRGYRAAEQIPTEHAQLDDNGDGRGTEVQLDFLEEELGGRAGSSTPPAIKPGKDGALAASMELDPAFGKRGEAAPKEKPSAEKSESAGSQKNESRGTHDEPAGKERGKQSP